MWSLGEADVNKMDPLLQQHDEVMVILHNKEKQKQNQISQGEKWVGKARQ